jgi:hypothetical protein
VCVTPMATCRRHGGHADNDYTYMIHCLHWFAKYAISFPTGVWMDGNAAVLVPSICSNGRVDASEPLNGKPLLARRKKGFQHSRNACMDYVRKHAIDPW